jgi:ERCC4-related helicase
MSGSAISAPISFKNSSGEKKLTRVQTLEKIFSKFTDKSRVIIYSNHDESFSAIKEMVPKKWCEMKGKRETREKSLKSFRDGETPFLLLTSQINSSGFNLPETTDVIFYHKVADPIEIQVLGRALRIGRYDELNVHHLV